MKQIYLVRHAESISNAGERTKNHDKIPLSKKGKLQAKELVDTLKIIPNLIVVSSYIRTYDTALPFIKKYKDTPVEIWDTHEFTYLNPKEYNNTTSHERWESIQRYWNKSDIHYKNSHDVESFHSFTERIKKFLERLKERKEKNIVVFSHGRFIKGVQLYLEKIKSNNNTELTENDLQDLMTEHKKTLGKEFPILNASINIIEI